MKNAIREPFRFILQNVIEGEKCVIHILEEGDFLVTYRLDKEISKSCDEEIITFESRATLDQKTDQSIKVKEQIFKILKLDKIYHNCTYCFCFKKDVFSLLSYSYNEAPFSYTLVQHLNNLLNLPTIKPNWSGVFSYQVLNSFYEDVFVQKK